MKVTEEEKTTLIPKQGPRTVKNCLLHLDEKYNINDIRCWRDDQGFHVEVVFIEKGDSN